MIGADYRGERLLVDEESVPEAGTVLSRVESRQEAGGVAAGGRVDASVIGDLGSSIDGSKRFSLSELAVLDAGLVLLGEGEGSSLKLISRAVMMMMMMMMVVGG